MRFKQNLLTLSCLGVLSSFSYAQNSYQAPLVTESLLLDLHKSENTIVVGERGHVLLQGENANFQQVVTPTKTTLTAVTQIGDKVWAVGHDATVIHSADAGQTWEVQLSLPDLDRPFLDVAFFDASQGIAVGAYGLFYRTNNGGKTWEKELHASVLAQEDIEYLETIKDDPAFYEEELSFILPHFNRLFIDQDRLLMAGEAGMLAVSNDKGSSWERFDIDYQGSFFDVSTLANDLTLAVGLRGNAFVKMQGTRDWQRIETCVTTSLNSIIEDQHLVVVGNNGVVLKLDPKKLASSELQQPDSEGCKKHIAVSSTQSGLSDAIMNGELNKNVLTAVTASGIKQIELN